MKEGGDSRTAKLILSSDSVLNSRPEHWRPPWDLGKTDSQAYQQTKRSHDGKKTLIQRREITLEKTFHQNPSPRNWYNLIDHESRFASPPPCRRSTTTTTDGVSSTAKRASKPQIATPKHKSITSMWTIKFSQHFQSCWPFLMLVKLLLRPVTVNTNPLTQQPLQSLPGARFLDAEAHIHHGHKHQLLGLRCRSSRHCTAK